MARKRLYFQDEDYNCFHPDIVHDGPGTGVHCVYCQQHWDSRKDADNFKHRNAIEKEMMLEEMFDI